VHDERRSVLVLVSGLSRAGKSTFARQFCEAIPGAQHLPLDHYFLAVPPGLHFLDWVQSPASLDWATLRAHLAQLSSGQSCYTPCLDWEGSGQRLSDGGARIAECLAGQAVQDWRQILVAHQPRYRDVLAYEAQADLVVDGTGTQRETFARAVEIIRRTLGQ
jgi:hypothetical protein